MQLRLTYFTIFLFFCSILQAQTIAFPDTALVRKNHIKTANIYLVASDGKRYMQKQLIYDRMGRLIIQRENETSFYYASAYYPDGRIKWTAQRSSDGAFIQKYTYNYNDMDSLRTVSLYTSADSSRPACVYVYNKLEQKVREEQYNNGQLSYLFTAQFDSNSDPVSTYDSSAVVRSASYRNNGLLVKQRSYDPQGNFLHEYRYEYSLYRQVCKISDSTGVKNTVHYRINYFEPNSAVEYIDRDGKRLSASEQAAFCKEHSNVLPTDSPEATDYGLPVPPMIEKHNYTYDKDGKIIRDDFVQQQGSVSETYVYVYEYEFY